jgi:hypothetical protein
VVGITVVDPYNLFSWSSISSLESKAAIWSRYRTLVQIQIFIYFWLILRTN